MSYFKRSTFIRAKSEELRENFLAYVFSVNGMLSKIYHHLVSRRIIDGKVPQNLTISHILKFVTFKKNLSNKSGGKA